MALHASSKDHTHITGYGKDFLAVNGTPHYTPLLVLPNRPPFIWSMDFPLQVSHLQHLLVYQPEVIILGTGCQSYWPDRKITQSLAQAGVGMEVMQTSTACGVYNVLAAEQRQVLAVLFLPNFST